MVCRVKTKKKKNSEKGVDWMGNGHKRAKKHSARGSGVKVMHMP